MICISTSHFSDCIGFFGYSLYTITREIHIYVSLLAEWLLKNGLLLQSHTISVETENLTSLHCRWK